ncbi:MAG: ATP-dependent 6-phosphofructokinase, partial [Lentisphaeria bacterium]|nr:ATP-dependent 6-phosphofructokinase [Lentisphaeria bacterium]
DVIKFITRTLRTQYGVPVVYGIPYGYRGLNPEFKHEPVLLTEVDVDHIHEDGGTVLGSSRGRQPEKIMVDTLARMNINMLFCIGGDGTLRCAHDIATEVRRRNMAISVIGIPKTIDNDISFIDKSFGFETAVYTSSLFVTTAHNEAEGAYNGIGLVKVMGRDSGFIAAHATLANSHVTYCLVPEKSFVLDGPDGLLQNLEKRLQTRHHAVIIVAEGAGQELFKEHVNNKDASGNILHQDIGLLLKERINAYFKERKMEVNLKYFDPSYTIRSVPAQGTDAVFCTMLAQNAVHAAMAGRTDMVVGHWHDAFTHVPIPLATSSRKKIDINGQLWNSVSSIVWM